jgi:hypothetical protein
LSGAPISLADLDPLISARTPPPGLDSASDAVDVLELGCALSRHRVIPRAGELDEIKAVAEWISHIGDTAVLTDLDVSIKRGAKGDQLSDHLVQIFHDEAEVNRRPMALVASNDLLGA